MSVGNIVTGQTKFFIGSDDDYSILMDENVTTKVSKNQTGYVDYYILRENNAFIFMLSITKVSLASDPDAIYKEDFKKSYLSECGCEIMDYKKIVFHNFTGISFKIKAKLDDKIVNGFSVSTISSGIIFNINFLTLEPQFNSLIPKYEKMLNSLIFK